MKRSEWKRCASFPRSSMNAKKLGYSTDKLRELVKLADEERGLRRRTAILRGELKKLTGEVKRVEREKEWRR